MKAYKAISSHMFEFKRGMHWSKSHLWIVEIYIICWIWILRIFSLWIAFRPNESWVSKLLWIRFIMIYENFHETRRGAEMDSASSSGAVRPSFPLSSLVDVRTESGRFRGVVAAAASIVAALINPCNWSAPASSPCVLYAPPPLQE
jgi:hypothetical protein